MYFLSTNEHTIIPAYWKSRRLRMYSTGLEKKQNKQKQLSLVICGQERPWSDFKTSESDKSSYLWSKAISIDSACMALSSGLIMVFVCPHNYTITGFLVT